MKKENKIYKVWCEIMRLTKENDINLPTTKKLQIFKKDLKMLLWAL